MAEPRGWTERDRKWQALRKESEQIIEDEKAGRITNQQAAEKWSEWRRKSKELHFQQEFGIQLLS